MIFKQFKQFKRLEDFESKLFDILRALSSFFVLLGHTYQSLILPRVEVSPIITKVIFALAGYSVMVFFALSGYMITLSLFLILKTAKVCSCFVENKVWILGILSSMNRLFLKKGINNDSV